MNYTATLLRLLETAILGVLEDRSRNAVNLTVSSLNARTESITGERLQNTIFLNTLERERTDTQSNIGASKAVFFENLVDFFATLNGNAIAINCLNVRVKNLVTLAVDSAAEMLPQLEHSLGYDFNTITGVTTHKHTAIVVHNLISQLRKNIVNDVPVIVRVKNCGETGVGVNLGQQTAQESNFVSVNRIVGTHNRVFSAGRTECNRLFGAIAVIHFLQIRDSRNGCSVQER